MNKLILLTCFCLLTLTMLCGCTKDKWEYKTVAVTSEGLERTGVPAVKVSSVNLNQAELQKLGEDGWELASSYLEMETAYANFGSEQYVTGLQPNVRPQRVVLIFKRKK